ncbi:MAG TPA: hypothetical protein VLU25_02100 [Acidobacteriota bacterium]|nr:hypothetical protein [Acidobacteriota bacterium]
MEKEVKVFSSFQEAEEADAAYYASLTPQERLDILLDMVARYRESQGEAEQRFERVYQVVELPQD